MSNSIPSDRDKALEVCYASIDNARIGVLWIDSEGMIINANRAACALLEYSADELAGHTFSDVDPDVDSTRWFDFWSRIRGNRKVPRETVFHTKGGSPLSVELSPTYIETGEFECVSIFFNDVSARRTAEEDLRRSRYELETRNESLNAINRIVNRLHRTLDLQAVVEESVRSMKEYIHFPSVVIFELDESGNELKLLHAVGFKEETLKVGSVLPVDKSLTGLSIINRDVVTSYDIGADPHIYPQVKDELIREGLVCAISVPVIAKNKVIGALNLISEERAELSSHERETLRSIGMAIGSALANAEQVMLIRNEIKERKRAEQQLRESREKWRSLVENFHDIVFITDYEGALLYTNPAVKDQTGFEPSEASVDPTRFPFIHDADADAVATFVSAFVAGDDQYSGTIDNRVVDAWGQLRWYSTAITKVTYEGKPALQFVSYDMTPRKHAELALQAALEEVRTLKNRLQEENVYLKEEIKLEHNADEIIGASGALASVMEKVRQVARTDATVLILGETGTGKELISRAIHELSKRHDRPMIKVNCSAIPKDLFESEFFGHVKGAFTGALKDRVGRFQLADGATLFLDEVGEIPLELQGKLLRVLQEGQFERVGDDLMRQVDVRIISSTNRDLEEEVAQKSFRQDLYFRLSVFPIEVPPLRNRIEDIPALARHFVSRISRRIGVPEVGLNDAHFRQLQSYSWPGNIRELENVIERSLITAQSGRINIVLPGTASGLAQPPPETQTGATSPATRILNQVEVRQLEIENTIQALEKTAWKIYGPGGAAELLGIKPSTLTARIKSWGIERDR